MLDLPIDIIEIIFDLCDVNTSRNLAQTCHYLNQMCLDIRRGKDLAISIPGRINTKLHASICPICQIKPINLIFEEVAENSSYLIIGDPLVNLIKILYSPRYSHPRGSMSHSNMNDYTCWYQLGICLACHNKLQSSREHKNDVL